MRDNLVCITTLQNRICAYHFVQNQIVRCYITPKQTEEVYANTTVVIGKVLKLSPGIGAAFVSLGGKMQYFMALPRSDAEEIFLLNRSYDGALKCGDELLVQVTKQPIKQKQPVVTSKLSFAGLYTVLEPLFGQGGKDIAQIPPRLQISAKLSRAKGEQIKKAFAPMLSDFSGYRLTIRTNAGQVQSMEEIMADAKALLQRVEHILQIAPSRTCYTVLDEPEAAWFDFVKNLPLDAYEEMVTDLPEVYEKLSKRIPKPLRLYEDSSYALAKLYALEEKTKQLLQPKVWLKSGGFLLIEQGETLTAIDVNSGKQDKKTDLCVATNLEAVPEIFRQIRARNISGMILIDFINMKDKADWDKLLVKVKEQAKQDAVKTQWIDVTGLGLVELTREKKLPSLRELF